MKKFFINLWYTIEINIMMALCHAFSFIPIAFNDTSISFNNIFDALPYTFRGNFLLIFVSVCLGYYYKKNPEKEDFDVKTYGIMQGVIILLWIMYYFSNLVK